MVEQKIQNFLDKKGIKRGFGLLNETTNEWIKIFDLLKEYEALSQHDVIESVCDCIQCGRKITDFSKASHGWLCDDC
jgi:hypothetical protein